MFLGMVMYDNEFQTKENTNWTKDKIELQHNKTTEWRKAIFKQIWNTYRVVSVVRDGNVGRKTIWLSCK